VRLLAAEKLALKYVRKAERVVAELKNIDAAAHPKADSARAVLEEAKRYLEDAKYYLDNGKPETSLASVAYCEGLLDALRMLGYVEFTW
jgi:FAD synthetase